MINILQFYLCIQTRFMANLVIQQFCIISYIQFIIMKGSQVSSGDSFPQNNLTNGRQEAVSSTNQLLMLDPQLHHRQKSRGKNAFMHVQDKVMGFGRVMPKQLAQDKQFLYSQNLKLKEKVRQLSQQNVRLKTRLSISQKQKDQIAIQAQRIANSTDLRPLSKSFMRKSSNMNSKLNANNGASSFQNNNMARRMFRNAKEEIQQLKIQNAKIKRTVKYTQISEMQIQNENLLDEINRLDQYIKDLLDSQQYQEYQQNIEQLKKKLQQEKEASKSINYQMRKKDDQINELRQKLRNQSSKKSDNQRRLTRQVNNLKNQITQLRRLQRSHLKQIKDRSLESRDSGSFRKKKACEHCTKYQIQIKQLNTDNELAIKKLKQQYNEKINVLNRQINTKNKQLQQLKRALLQKQAQKKVDNYVASQTKIMKKSQPNQHFQKNQIQAREQEEKPTQPVKNQKKKTTQKKEESDDNYGEQFQDDKKNQVLQKQENGQNAYIQDDDFEQQEPSKKKDESKKHVKSEDNYQDQFSQEKPQKIQQQEQILFKKQQPPKQSQKKKSKNIDRVLQQTIMYKFMAQRYTYEDFTNDLKNSQIKKLTPEDVIGLISNEPFFLLEDQQETILVHCFAKKKIEASDQISVSTFLKKMKPYIGEVQLVDEQQEITLVSNISNYFKEKQKTLKKQFKKAQKSEGLVNKKSFIEIMTKHQFKKKQLQYCLGQICVCSPDVENLNYLDFIDRFTKGQQQENE